MFLRLAARANDIPVTAPADPLLGGDGAAAVEMRVVEQARQGNVAAWTALYTQHYPLVFRRIRLLTGTPAVAEDLAQETFVQAMLEIANFAGRSRFSTWLCGIAMNLVRMWWRRHAVTERVHDKLAQWGDVAPEPRGEQPDHVVMHEARVAALYAALDQLPEPLRTAFVLRDLEGLTPQDAAAELGISINNLLVRATRARAKIREYLADQGWPEAKT